MWYGTRDFYTCGCTQSLTNMELLLNTLPGLCSPTYIGLTTGKQYTLSTFPGLLVILLAGDGLLLYFWSVMHCDARPVVKESPCSTTHTHVHCSSSHCLLLLDTCSFLGLVVAVVKYTYHRMHNANPNVYTPTNPYLTVIHLTFPLQMVNGTNTEYYCYHGSVSYLA